LQVLSRTMIVTFSLNGALIYFWIRCHNQTDFTHTCAKHFPLCMLEI
jgi:hypothetical protein